MVENSKKLNLNDDKSSNKLSETDKIDISPL